MTIKIFLEKYSFLIATIVLICVFLLIRFMLTRLVRNWKVQDPKNNQNLMLIANQLPTLILIVGLLIIWGQELRDFAISLVAVAAAIVLATKEIILCFMGGLLKVSSKLFEIDDRISVAGFRGKVRDHNLMTTELLEIGPGPKSNQTTGKLIKIPNSIFLSNTVSIVPSAHDYILHIITMTLPISAIDWDLIENTLLASAKEICKEFEQNLIRYKEENPEMITKFHLDQEPKVFLDLNSKDSLDISLRLCLPYEGMSRIENDIKKNFIQKLSFNNVK